MNNYYSGRQFRNQVVVPDYQVENDREGSIVDGVTVSLWIVAIRE